MNPSLDAYNNNCTHAVAVWFLGEWSIVTRCLNRADACMCLRYWRARSAWRHKIMRLK